MPLPAGFSIQQGRVLDGEGRQVFKAIAGGAPLDPTHKQVGGAIRDPDGREVVVVEGLSSGTPPRGKTQADYGLKAWSASPEGGSSDNAPPAGVLQVLRARMVVAGTLGSLRYSVGTAGTGTTALANCFLGVYALDGTLLGTTADQAAAMGTAGVKTAGLTAVAGKSPTFALDDLMWLGLLIGTQSTTALRLHRTAGGHASLVNFGLPAPDLVAGGIGSGLTALPASFVPGNLGVATQWIVGAL